MHTLAFTNDFRTEAKRRNKLTEEASPEEHVTREAKVAKIVHQAQKSALMSLGDDYVVHGDVKVMSKSEVEQYRSEVGLSTLLVSLNFIIF